MPTLPSDSAAAHAVARLLGRPLLPYQASVVEALSRPEPADPDRYAATSAVLVMPRQTGKTTTLFTLALARMLRHEHYAAAYTAQTGHTVTERFSDPGGWLDSVASSPLAARHALRRSQGTERVTNLRTRSYVKAFPPKPGKLRGNALDLVVLDECQEHDWLTGSTLDGDVGPVFTTRPRRQLVYAGTASGPSWWAEKYDAARRGDLLLVELGTWPEDADPADPATWHAYHPGLRAGLTDEQHMRDELTRLGVETFSREYGNRWGRGAGVEAPVPLVSWDACPGPLPGEPLAVGFDVTPDREWCTVVGVTDSDTVRVLSAGPLDRLEAELARHAEEVPVYALPAQTGTAADLRAAGIPVTVLTGSQYREACQRFADAVTAGAVRHDHPPRMREALEHAGRSWHGDAWVLSARRSTADITPAAAAVVAWWAAHQATALIV